MSGPRITDLESLLAAVRRGDRPDYLLFWGHRASASGGVGKECLSQWCPASFVVGAHTYPTAEHFMMAEKARLFGDEETRQRILEASEPRVVKELGRKVRGFDERAWADSRYGIVVEASFAKFAQNPALRSFLLGTKERVLVEASPVDTVWGIGLSAQDPNAKNPEHWRGLNLLGFALMDARHRLAREPA